MATDTVLTDTQAVDLAYIAGLHLADLGSATQERAMAEFARAIEQAVLQSPEVQRLREDAARYRAWRKAMVTDDIDFLNVYIEFDDGSIDSTEDHMDRSIDAAMEKQP